jgi:hypothetical protein
MAERQGQIGATGMSSPYSLPRKPYAYGGDPPPLPAWYLELRARVDAELTALEEADDAS